jgi:opacity protein-like surface antigen
MTPRISTIALGLLGAAMCGSAVAEGFYLGIEGARERITFKPHYYMLDGTPDGSFTNRARGNSAGLLLGHRWQLAPRVSLALEGRLSASDTRWTLSIPEEPARFRYDIPYSAAVTLQPTVHVTEVIGVYAEGGFAYGRIRERKSAPATSAYDARGWREGRVLGAGVSLKVGQAWSARVGYRETRYSSLSYTARLGDGTPVERVRDRPRVESWHFGLMRSF